MPKGLQGFQKGGIAWNKDKKRPPFSEEWKRNMSLTHKGNKNALGKHHKLSKEHKEKISLSKKGKKRLCISGKNHPNWKNGITSIRNKIYNSLKYKQWRQQIFLRDNFACQKCNDDTGGNLHAHHKNKSFKQLLQEVKNNLPLLDLYDGVMIYTPFWNINNGITYCEKCHKKIHYQLKKG